METMLKNSKLSLYGIGLLRIHYGIILIAHGWLKISIFTVSGTVAYFSSLGLPSLIAYLVIFGEIVGGIALLLGVQVRLASLLSVPIVFGAAIVSSGNGWVHSASGGGWEYAASLTVIAIVVTCVGSGYLSVGLNPLNRLLPKFLKD